MKRLIFSCLCAAAVGCAMADNPLVVRLAEGDTQVEVEKISHITFDADGSVCVHCTDGTSITAAADKFVSLRFNSEHSGIEAVVAGADSSLSLGADGIISASVPCIVLYDAAGQRVASSESNSLSTSGLQPGVYIVSAGDASLKIIVK